MPETNTPTPEQALLSWSAPVQHTHTRSMRWYIAGGIMVVASAAYGVLSGAWSVTLVTVMIGAMYFILRDHRFPDETITLTPSGVRIGGRFLPWNEAQGYWLLPAEQYMELHITPKTRGATDLMIQTGSIPIDAIKDVISAYVPELTEKRERLLDAFIRICKL